MKISMVMWKQAHPLLNIPSNSGRIDMPVIGLRPQTKDKVVVVMGATGTGKSRLSIDIATRLAAAEIVNSDKMQVYQGLDIVTNKITEEESRGVPHHLLGVIDPNADFTAMDFCKSASASLKSIVNRGQLPIIVGGSNSYIEELVENEDFGFRSRYECCFLWVDVSMPVLQSFLCGRVDRMVEAGMVDEVRKMFETNANYSRGIRRAIGVPELDAYFRAETCWNTEIQARLLHEAIQAIKDNTCQLACRQLKKIRRLRDFKRWKVHRLDATDVFRKSGKEDQADQAWDELVARPTSMIVSQFLYNFSPDNYTTMTMPAIREPAMAAATH